MKYSKIIFFLVLLTSTLCFSQETIVKGSVNDQLTGVPVSQVTVTIEGTNLSQQTDANGEFSFTQDVPLGEQVLSLSKEGYLVTRFPIVVNEGQTVNITDMFLNADETLNNDFVISLSDDQLNDDNDNGITDNISGLLQSSRDVFLNAAAFDFSATFFRPRGLDNANGKVLINGMEMNKQFNGRPQWANWGGLNDAQRNREFSMGISPNDYTFGDLAGTTNIIMRASKNRKGGRVSAAAANRSYQGRVMGSYNSGILEGGWAYSVLASRRFGDEGYIDGTLYDANSFFVSVEKIINKNHSLNLLGIYAQNRRGRSTAITDEIYRLKGRQYNPFWGYQDDDKRNSRIREVEEPIIMLNHYWDISENTQLNTNVAYQFGKIGNTRIDNNGTQLETIDGIDYFVGGARNPGPEYYQNLPSYFLQDPNPTAFDYQQAFLAQQQFVNDGQFDWERLYVANASQEFATYAIQEDRNDDKQFSANTILTSQLQDNIILNASLNYRKLKSENFAELQDLFGAQGYLDVDSFAEEGFNDLILGNIAQSDLQNPNRMATEGDRYKYNYEIDANVLNAFAQAQFKYNTVDFYIGANLGKTSYQRNGLFENGYYPGNRSLDESEKLDFNTYGIKGGFTYKISGKHLADFNAAYLTKAPGFRNAFGNARQNNDLVIGIEEEKIQTIDASYIYRSPIVKARLTGFYTNFTDGTDIGFFFSEGASGSFVQEVLTNIEKRHIGGELGIEAQVLPTLKVKAVAALGQYTFNNNPNLYYTSDDFANPLSYGDGTVKLKNYHIAGGPERAYQLGFEYRDPDFWNIGVTTNYYSNANVDVSALKRSDIFLLDQDIISDDVFAAGGNITGQSISDYDETTAKKLLSQEELDDYFLVNVTGGKSWKIGDYFVGFFAVISNILDKEYRTGGFEQSRRVDYRNQLTEQTNPNGPIFGNRYFFGNGTTYYINLYLRF